MRHDNVRLCSLSGFGICTAFTSSIASGQSWPHSISWNTRAMGLRAAAVNCFQSLAFHPSRPGALSHVLAMSRCRAFGQI
eukprot:644192-Alexandrium_andersonii.AAC.1